MILKKLNLILLICNKCLKLILIKLFKLLSKNLKIKPNIINNIKFMASYYLLCVSYLKAN